MRLSIAEVGVRRIHETLLMRYRLGPLMVDADRRAVVVADRALEVEPKVVEVLVLLCEQAGNFVSKESLIARVWPDGDGDERAVWRKVHLARKMLAAHAGAGAIETLPRRGYRLTVVAQGEAPATPLAVIPARRRWYAPVIAASTLVVLAFVCVAFWSWPRATALALDAPTQRAYNLGRYFFSLRTYDSARKAEREFARVAASKERNVAALGYAGLADTHRFLSAQRRGREAIVEMQAARRAAETALRLDPQSVEAAVSLGSAFFLSEMHDARRARARDAAAARASFETAVAEQPRYARGQLVYGEYLFSHGDPRAAADHLQRAIDLDPADAAANVAMARAAYVLGDMHGAVSYASRAMEFKTSDEEDAFATRGLAYEQLHRFDDALRAFHELMRYTPARADALIAYIEAERGQRSRAARRLEEAVRHRACDCGDFWLDVALAQSMLGEREAAIASVQRMAHAADFSPGTFAYDPRLAVARRDARLRDALANALGSLRDLI
jgi:DNA-binding winged helix-turn-helix (wHTH) protein/tetratricopeptide (TPR) repeat protein